MRRLGWLSAALLSIICALAIVQPGSAQIVVNPGSGSGSSTPGGADTQIQFNNAGAFGGSADLVWSGAGGLAIGNGGGVTGQDGSALAVSVTPSANASDVIGMWVAVAGGNHTITQVDSLLIDSNNGMGNVTNQSALRIENTFGATNNYALKIENMTADGIINHAINYADKFVVNSTGEFQVNVVNTAAPTGTDCDAAGETGKYYWDSTNDNLYVCSGASGWRKIATAAP